MRQNLTFNGGLMQKSFEIKGLWWIPEKPDKKYRGSLKYIPNKGIYLEIEGIFGELLDINNTEMYDAILGISNKNELITLSKCWVKNISIGFPKPPSSTYFAHLLFVGGHFEKPESALFDRVYVKYAYLDEWVNIYGFQINQEHDETGSFSIKYQKPADINETINDNLTVSIRFNIQLAIPTLVKKELHPKQTTYLYLKFSDPTCFEDYVHLVFVLQNFFTLATCEEVFLMELIGIIESNKQAQEGKTIHPNVRIYFIPISKVSQEKEIYPHQMFFTYTDIKDKFGIILKNWIEKEETLRPFYNLYFAVQYNSSLFSENKFLNYVQALETYYGRLYNGGYLPESTCKEIYDCLVSAIPDLSIDGYKDFKMSLTQRLKYINEYSLRKKLKVLVNGTGDLFDKYVENRNLFVESVVDTRNYLTHYSTNLEHSAAKGTDIFQLAQKMQILIEILMLREIGFNLDEIRQIFHKNNRYRSLEAGEGAK